MAEGNSNDGVRLGYDLLRDPGTAEVGHAVLGVCQLSTATPVQAWAEFVRVGNPELRTLCWPEYAIAGFGADPAACAALCAELIAEHPDVHHRVYRTGRRSARLLGGS